MLCAILVYAPGNVSSEIDWCNGSSISWNDFWGNPDPYSRFSAISATYLQEKHFCNEYDRFRYSVRSVFVRKQSWSRDKKSAKLLHHEQIHFNLTELHARKLRKLFSELQYPCFIPEARIKYMVDSLYEKMEYAHRFYDEDTFHGLNTKRQEFWTDMVTEALFDLEEFACTQ